QAPVITQLTGVVGQLGAIGAATPLSKALSAWGWTPAFLTAAGFGAVLSIGLILVVKDSPYVGERVERIKLRAVRRSLADVWGNPGTRLGLWTHFTAQFGATVFAMLWGYPFLVKGQQVDGDTASALIMLMTATGMLAGPVIGRMTGRLPFRRSQLVLGIVAAMASIWAVVLLWPGRAPLWLLIVLVVVTAIGGPGSMVGFDLARTFHDSSRLGRASGVVNVGGFVAALLTIAAIGLTLDWVAPNGPDSYNLHHFRIAMSLQFVFWVVGSVQIVRYRRKALDYLAQFPGAVEALRAGQTLVPGLSTEAPA
ncbi:MAG TPA: MFS transporter, partial [Ilumatobacteraceae bacterium]|nr:MFS transporter [Ilumatobacteraceae bacterium]